MDRARPPTIYATQKPRQYRFEDDSLHHHARRDHERPASSISSGSSAGAYAGFDFDFPGGLAPMPAAHGRESIVAPTDRRESDVEPTGLGIQSTELDEAVIPRPRPTGRDPDYFMRRADWKRRGIVFTPEVLLASEEESFYLP